MFKLSFYLSWTTGYTPCSVKYTLKKSCPQLPPGFIDFRGCCTPGFKMGPVFFSEGSRQLLFEHIVLWYHNYETCGQVQNNCFAFLLGVGESEPHIYLYSGNVVHCLWKYKLLHKILIGVIHSEPHTSDVYQDFLQVYVLYIVYHSIYCCSNLKINCSNHLYWLH